MTEWSEQTSSVLSAAPDNASAHRTSAWLHALLVLIVIVGGALCGREALFYFGLPVDLRTVSTVLGTSLLFLCVLTTYVAVVSTPLPRVQHAYWLRVGILAGWAAVMLGVGLIEDNNAAYTVTKEFCGFLMLLSFLVLGPNDEVWKYLKKPLVILFYTTLVLILFTRDIPGTVMTQEGFVARRIADAPRGLDTIAFGIRAAIDLGPLLFAWGMASRKKDVWRFLMIAALAIYVAIEALVFEFRGAAVAAAVVLLTYFLLAPATQVKIPVGAIIGLLFAAGVGFVIASQTQAFNNLLRRFDQQGGMFDSRFDEADHFFNDMSGLDLTIGRGFAGTYSGPDWAPMSEYKGRMIWGANHFGFLGFVLRGGFPLLLFAATFLIPFFLRKPPGWYENEFNFAAMMTIPWLMLNILLNPFDFFPDSFLMLLLWGLCFSRLSTSGSETSWQQPLPAIDSEY